MGISIYYSGQLKKEASINKLIEEVKDIAENMKWTFHVLDTELPEYDDKIKVSDGNLYGIVFAPPECEPVWMTVLNNRRLAMSINLGDFEIPFSEVDEMSYMCFTKTQFAGPEAHKVVIAILKYLSEKYFCKFELKDEANYWESGDEAKLFSTFKKYNILIDSFVTGLENATQLPGETLEDVIKRIFKNIQDKR